MAPRVVAEIRAERCSALRAAGLLQKVSKEIAWLTGRMLLDAPQFWTELQKTNPRFMNNQRREEVLPRPERVFAPIAAACAGLCLWPATALFAQSVDEASPHQLAPVTVSGRNPSLHDVNSESDRVGPANQPEWTTRRAFAETDIYVIPPGEIEFNQFYISSHPRDGEAENLFESEFEFGLPWRTQFDVELNYRLEEGHLQHDSTLVELPHALADWGTIPLNPTIDAGWRFNVDEADAYFFRLLLAEEFGRRFHFGANLSYERQNGGENENVYELNAALSYVAIDSKLTLGAELLVEYETTKEIEDDEIERTYDTTVMLGPTALYKPTRNTHLGVVALFGLTQDSSVEEVFFTFGIDFEPFARHRASS